MELEWDSNKATLNVRQHRVTFNEAATLWNDDQRIEDLDVVHTTEHEERFQVLGLSEKLRFLVVIFTKRHETIRLISARRANEAEKRRYTLQG